MKFPRKVLGLALVLVMVVVGILLAAGEKKKASPTLKEKRIARGKYLVDTMGCEDCHTPKVADAPPMTFDPALTLSGRPKTTPAPSKPNPGEGTFSLDLTAWHGPWGVSYAANLTPDPTTGIGARYDEAKFIQTLRSGKKPEGEPLLPPMPWTAFRYMSDEDLKSLYAYLTTLKPVKNFVRDATPPASTK